MDEKSKAKLNRLLWRQRLRDVIPAAAISAAMLAIYMLFIYDNGAVEKATTQATVLSWSVAQTEKGRGPFLIWVRLEDGTKVLVAANRNGRTPIIDDIIQIEKVKSKLGRVSYRWNR